MENQSFISLQERTEMPFINYGGENYKIRIVDLQKAVTQAIEKRGKNMTAVVEIRPIRIDKYKETKVTISYAKDDRTGIYYGIPMGLHPDGNVMWRKITLTDRNIFDLRNFEEAKQWFVARFNPYVLGTPFPVREALFKVWDPEEQAALDLRKAGELQKALTRAKTLKSTNLLNFARFLGQPLPPDLSLKLLRAEITRFAMMDPLIFNQKYDDPEREIAEIFYSAGVHGIITYDMENGHIFKGVQLGFSPYDAILFLKKETMTLAAISSLVKTADKAENISDDDEKGD